MYNSTLFIHSTVFSSSDVAIQQGYPRQEDLNLQVSIALHIPSSATLLSSDTIPLVPGDALISIVLGAATPFYHQTGRPVLQIESYMEQDDSRNMGLILGTSVPLGLLGVAGCGILTM